MERYLVVIDMQKDFIDGALGSEMAQGIVPQVIKRIGEYKPDHIYATRDTHFANYQDTLEGKKLPVVHCVKETDGWQIDERVAAAMPKARIFDKYTFGSEELAEEMYRLSLRDEMEIELAGLCTDICVVSNALLLGKASGDGDQGGPVMLCRRYQGEPQGGAKDHENVPD